MAETITNPILDDVISTYNKLLETTATNAFYTGTKQDIETAINSLSITDEKKAEMLVNLNTNMAASTISKAMDQSILFVDRVAKMQLEIDGLTKDNTIKDKQILDIVKSTEVKAAQITSISKDNAIKDKQALKLDEEIDLVIEQINEMKESILDRQQKRPVEVANLTKQGLLIDAQVAKILEDKLYVIAQKTSMLEQVGHNKLIKAMDAIADMIGTLGAGGLKPSTKMFEIFFTINQMLTTVNAPSSSADLSLTKA